MADSVTYSKIITLVDDTQYIAALKKAEAEEKLLADLRTAGGAAAVKALRETEKAQQQQAKEAARAAAAEVAAAEKKAAYLERLRLQSYKDEQKAAAAAEAAAKKAAAGPSAWTLALQENSAALKASAQELSSFRGQINLGAESLGKVGAALSMVDPQLGTLVGTLQKVTGIASAGASGVELLGSAMTAGAAAAGVLLVAASPLIALWHDHTEAVEASARAMKILNDVQDDGLSLVDRSKTSIAELTLERSGLTDAQKAEQKLALDWQKSLKSANDEIDRQIRLAEAQIGQNDDLAAINAERRRSGEEELEVIRKSSPQFEAQTALLKGLREEKEKNATAAKQGFEAERELVKIRRENEDADKQLEEAERALEEAKKKGEKATKDAAEAERERERIAAMQLKRLLAEADAETKRLAALEDARAALAALQQTSELALATEEERIRLAAQASREAVVAAANEAQAASNSSAERKRIAQDLSDTIININVNEANQLQALEDRKTADATAAADQRAKDAKAAADKNAAEISEAYSMASDALGDYFDSVLSSSSDKITELEAAIKKANENGATGRAASLKRQLAAEKEAATKAFEWQQTLSAANATVNWLEALVKATTYGPVGGPLVAGAATLAYGLSLKQIESQEPSFNDTPPGGYRMGPGQQTVRGAANDTAILFRDPLEGFAQALEVMAARQAPTSTPKRRGRSLLGVSAATTPVSRLLTRDVERATRGQL